MESNGLQIIGSPCLSYYIFVPSLSKILPNDLFQTFMTEKHISYFAVVTTFANSLTSKEK